MKYFYLTFQLQVKVVFIIIFQINSYYIPIFKNIALQHYIITTSTLTDILIHYKKYTSNLIRDILLF